jgi:hypothetical protein
MGRDTFRSAFAKVMARYHKAFAALAAYDRDEKVSEDFFNDCCTPDTLPMRRSLPLRP